MEINEGKARLEINDLLEKIRDKLGTNDHVLFFLLLKSAKYLCTFQIKTKLVLVLRERLFDYLWVNFIILVLLL